MIDDAKFDGKVRAHLLYAASLPTTAEGTRILMKHLDSGKWEDAPIEWFSGAWLLSQRDDSTRTYQQFLDLWLRRVAQGRITEAVQTKLADAVSQVCSDGEYRTFLTALGRWFVEVATPGHAGTCANVLDRIHAPRHERDGDDTLPAEAMPLVKWILQNGAAELRSPSRQRLVHRLVGAVHVHGEHELLEVALRYLLHADHAVGGWMWNRDDGQWPVIEAALEAGTPSSLVEDITVRLLASRAPGGEQVWRPLLDPGRFPRARTALLKGLAAGAFSEQSAKQGWEFAVRSPLPEDPPRFTHAAPAEVARESLGHFIAFERDKGHDMAEVGRWAAYVCTETLRIHDALSLAGAPAAVIDRINHLVVWDDAVLEAIERELRTGLEGGGSHLDLARSVLTEDGRPRQRVQAALHCLPVRGSGRIEQPKADLRPLRDEFARMVNLPWHEPVFGVPVSKLLGAVREVELKPLANHDKVAFEGETLLLDPGYYRESVSALGFTDEARQLCSLYFFHELVHVWQGIGAYSAVQELRSTGAEMTLMHVDIAADHAAALMAAKAVPRWELLALKNLTGRSLSHFPASTFHTEAARHRKAVRLVSHRLDYLARKSGAVPKDKFSDGYVFADFGPAGGRLLVMGSGPPTLMIKGAPLTPQDAKVLVSAADEHAPDEDIIARIDAVLMRALASQKPSS